MQPLRGRTKQVMKTITYYAVARNEENKVAQLLVTRVMAGPGVCVSMTQEWTGVTYRNEREAMKDTGRLNGCS